MINLIWIYLVTQAIWTTGSWAMYHKFLTKTISPPELLRNDSNFGFSIAHRQTTKSLLISAPTADTTGRLYSCDIGTLKCNRITKNIPREYNYTHDYWLGATIRAGSTFTVTCAPLQIQKSFSYKLPVANGLCFKIPDNSNNVETLPQITVENRVSHTSKLEDTIDSFGWAIDVASDNSIIVGGPAMFTGRVMKYSKSTANKPKTKSGIGVKVKHNFGYSVASGYFLSNDQIVYAVGTPFGSDGRGQVIFLSQDLDTLQVLTKKTDVNMVGTMFGAVLCSAHLKGKSDLLVGAPTYARGREYNVGAVYIYLWHNRNQKYERTLVGYSDGSFFGSAIISVGDLNGDKKDEIVIAAPYEDDGRGVVYLYNGADLIGDKSPQYLQKIQSENEQGFGLSLAPIKDYDENGCNELAVGAPETNTVMVFSCIASVTIQMFTVFPDLQNRKTISELGHAGINETYFSFQSCMNVTYPPKLTKIVATLLVTVEITHPDAVLADPINDAKYTISLHEKKSSYCKNIGVLLPLNGTYDLEIRYKINTILRDDPSERDEFEPSRVLLSPHSVLSVRDSVWAAECNGNNTCEPELDAVILSSIPLDGNYLSGSSDSESIDIMISNTGDTAYSTFMTVLITGAPVKTITSNTCSRDSINDMIKCTALQPLRTNDTWNAGKIVIDTSQITNRDEQISVHVNLYSGSKSTNNSIERHKDIKLISDYSRIVFKGNTDNGNTVNLTVNDVKYQGKKFEHIYTITNDGYTNLMDVLYKVSLPRRNYIDYSDVTLYVEDSKDSSEKLNKNPCAIIIEDEYSKFDTAICEYNKLEKKRVINVIVSLKMIPGKLQITDKENVTVYTNLSIIVDTKVFEHNIVSVMTLQEATVPLWIIILAVVIGFMILFIIALVLRELGLLRRKNKEKLDRLQKSIRRQTIRRSMMAQGSRSERQRILDDEKEAVQINDDVKEAKCLFTKND